MFALNEAEFVDLLSIGLIAIFFAVFVRLVSGDGTTAPYGRYSSNAALGINWGFEVNVRVAWVIQELPSFAVPIVCFVIGPVEVTGCTANRVLLSYFLIHYTNRTFIYPMRIKGGKPTPVKILLLAFIFCTCNGYIQGRTLTALKTYDNDHLTTAEFIIGSLLFWTGLGINWQADSILRNLRKKPGETAYFIPHGGMFNFVSGANFFGEIVEWFGFALACGFTVPALSFAICTLFNIAPRAISHHDWYLGKFDGYEKLGRKRIIPFIY